METKTKKKLKHRQNDLAQRETCTKTRQQGVGQSLKKKKQIDGGGKEKGKGGRKGKRPPMLDILICIMLLPPLQDVL